VAIVLKSKPGLSSTTTLNIPKDWDPTWFRNLISNQLKGADVRNAVGVNGIVVSGNISSPYATIGFGAPVTLPGPVTISAPATGTALYVYGANGAFNTQFISNNVTGNSFGVRILAGTNASDDAFVITNAAGTFNDLVILGDGEATFQSQAGTPVTILGSANTVALNIQGGVIEINEISNGNQILLDATGTDYGVIGVSAAQTWFLGYALTPATTPTPVLSWSQPGQVTISGGGGSGINALVVNGGVSQTWTVEIFNPSSSAGTNYGLLIEAGRTTADYAMYVVNYNDTGSVFYVNGVGGVGIGVAPGVAAGTLSVESNIIAGSYFQTGQGTYLMASSVAFTAGATGNAPTLTAGPVTGNPTKWIAIDDNGTVRHIPAW